MKNACQFLKYKNNALIIKNIYDRYLLYYQKVNLVLIFEWQFFATLIQAVKVMEISFIEFRFCVNSYTSYLLVEIFVRRLEE